MECLLLGQDHAAYADVTTVAVTKRSAASISVGADKRSPSLQYKGQRAVPNEDAACVVESGELVFLAVADAHFGHESSHVLIAALHSAATGVMPSNERELVEVVRQLGDLPDPKTASECSLVVVLYDRGTGIGSAVSFGDSTVAVVSAADEYRPINDQDTRYVAAGHAQLVDCWASQFKATTGDTLLMFTDGIDECHYRKPATSVQAHHIVGAVKSLVGEPHRISELLTRMALAGVDGHPGGQDNIALVVAQA